MYPIISIGVVCYNQEAYIGQCLDSILAQDTQYSFEVVVCDDGSQDQTQNIILEYAKRYPNIVRPILNDTNCGIGENYRTLFKNLQGRYVMLCEGDDYWINPRKIEHQVAFMERNLDYGFLSGRVLWQRGDYFQERPCFYRGDGPEYHVCNAGVGAYKITQYEDTFEYAICGPVTHTSAICFRREFIEPYQDEFGAGFDMALQAILASQTKFAILDEFVSVYRLNVGICGNRKAFEKRQYYWKNFWLPARYLELKIWPTRCPWTKDEVEDQYRYVLLKYYIRHVSYNKAKNIKKQICSSRYKDKKYVQHLHGPLSMLFLYCILCCKKQGKTI